MSEEIVWVWRFVPEHYKEHSERQKRLSSQALLDCRDLYSSPAAGTQDWHSSPPVLTHCCCNSGIFYCKTVRECTVLQSFLLGVSLYELIT